MDDELFAVLTGDIVGSTKLEDIDHRQLLKVLKSSFEDINLIVSDFKLGSFEVYRGDSFQGVLKKPKAALKAVVAIRAGLRKRSKPMNFSIDVRIGVGIGTIDYLPDNRTIEGDGEAFRLSGPALDEMKVDQRLAFRTPWDHINDEINTECALLDAIINKWTPEQAEAVLLQLKGLTQQEAGEELGISQPAVRKRLKRAGGWAIKQLCNRYEAIITQTVE